MIVEMESIDIKDKLNNLQLVMKAKSKYGKGKRKQKVAVRTKSGKVVMETRTVGEGMGTPKKLTEKQHHPDKKEAAGAVFMALAKFDNIYKYGIDSNGTLNNILSLRKHMGHPIPNKLIKVVKKLAKEFSPHLIITDKDVSDVIHDNLDRLIHLTAPEPFGAGGLKPPSEKKKGGRPAGKKKGGRPAGKKKGMTTLIQEKLNSENFDPTKTMVVRNPNKPTPPPQGDVEGFKNALSQFKKDKKDIPRRVLHAIKRKFGLNENFKDHIGEWRHDKQKDAYVIPPPPKPRDKKDWAIKRTTPPK